MYDLMSMNHVSLIHMRFMNMSNDIYYVAYIKGRITNKKQFDTCYIVVGGV
jgi:hypothetical protein